MKILSRANVDNFAEWYDSIPEEGGIVLVDKQKGWTSFDVVAKLRGILKTRKIGHAGTLDPLATGLLLVCVGKATKLSNSFQEFPKQYKTKIKLGATTKTYDLESEEENLQDVSQLKSEDITNAIMQFSGDLMQIPPLFSAISINGVRAYKLARQESDIQLAARPVTIYGYGDITIELPYAEFTVDCSKGTYIRSLANDVGKVLGCGSYLSELRRTKVADYFVGDALTIDELSNCRKIYDNSIQQ